MSKFITVKDAQKLTGLSQPTITNWALIKNQEKVGNVYIFRPEFIDFLKKNIKPKKRRKKIDR